MNKSVFKAHVKTFDLAKTFTGSGNVSTVSNAMQAPFCLRVVKEYRTEEIQNFRNEVAKRMRLLRGV